MSESYYGLLDEEKVFKDPVHRYIHVRDELIWALIGTKEFQRLRRVRQLGTTFLTFHGAEHTRFNHSLGVYEITRRIIEVFQGRPYWNEEERLLTLCAALLHDIGHGPFSHSFEKVFDTDHEEWTRRMIVGDTEIHNVLLKMGDDFPQKVADVIEKTYPNKLVTSIISSQIDADRMDYLQRDAYYTGVSYGHFDMERILRVMRPMEDQVVIKQSGMHAVEDYIMSRYQMYWQVYFHPVTRSAEVILSKVFKRVKDLYEQGYKFKQEPKHFYSLFEGNMSLDDYLRLDESITMYYFQIWQEEEDRILSDLCVRFINRQLFKYIEFNPNLQMNDWPRLQQLFAQAEIDPEYYLVVDSSSDLPYDFYRPGEEEERLPIHLIMPNGKLRELSRESDVVEAISGKKRTDHKLYFPMDCLTDQSDHKEIKQEILSLLFK
ncbi:HD domain-containing protein [Halalkalibacterium halodurans]|uniref:BH3818 protein n=2 Tax=Halalkalibacterium halodurans TaxID=86665 RepID=Q9K6B1_HALH5|nr:HD domain-containing protein [Halalkalibacterium halodurans]MDY7224322.1 HD domain-containing protein [Halalkalibacterium halodurans]MDY7243607.1 HD domain-containing protein [Halalkalibacterium halodurans]MED3646474.1 HD domain-containing protein [Halalkalibacterium halodurans]MED4079527.1 HD domain-containing protein [Halalkalibacterium halodurans]MED4084196.1 HD domain-containing protein [Halalkalibacterium halodurans]